MTHPFARRCIASTALIALVLFLSSDAPDSGDPTLALEPGQFCSEDAGLLEGALRLGTQAGGSGTRPQVLGPPQCCPRFFLCSSLPGLRLNELTDLAWQTPQGQPLATVPATVIAAAYSNLVRRNSLPHAPQVLTVVPEPLIVLPGVLLSPTSLFTYTPTYSVSLPGYASGFGLLYLSHSASPLEGRSQLLLLRRKTASWVLIGLCLLSVS